MKRAVLVAFASLGLMLLSGGSASAEVADGSLALNGDASVSRNGRALVVTGQVQCDAGQRVRITANPMSGVPNARGKTALVCSGAPQAFELTVRMRGHGTRFSDMAAVQLFARADSGDDVDSVSADVGW